MLVGRGHDLVARMQAEAGEDDVAPGRGTRCEPDLLRVGGDERREARARRLPQVHHAREVRQAAAAGCDVALELGAHGVVGRAGDRPEGACVQVGDPIQDGELGPRVGERHPTIRSTGG